MKAKSIFLKAKSIFILFALAAIAVSFSACNTEIKLKHLDGKWVVKSFVYSSNSTVTNSTDYNDNDCGSEFSCTEENTESSNFNGTTFTGTYENDFSADCFPDDNMGSYQGTLTWSIEINEDGSYSVTISYSAECTVDNSPADDVNFTYTGNYASAKKTWYIDDASAKQSVITFLDFPFVDFSGTEDDACNGVSIVEFAEMTFRIEKEDKDNMTLKGESSINESVNQDRSYTGFNTSFEEIDCEQMTSKTTIKTETWSLNLSK